MLGFILEDGVWNAEFVRASDAVVVLGLFQLSEIKILLCPETEILSTFPKSCFLIQAVLCTENIQIYFSIYFPLCGGFELQRIYPAFFQVDHSLRQWVSSHLMKCWSFLSCFLVPVYKLPTVFVFPWCILHSHSVLSYLLARKSEAWYRACIWKVEDTQPSVSKFSWNIWTGPRDFPNTTQYSTKVDLGCNLSV